MFWPVQYTLALFCKDTQLQAHNTIIKISSSKKII